MRFDIQPYLGAGALALGTKRTEVRKSLGKGFEAFMRGGKGGTPCDYFSTLGIFVYYKPVARVNAIEFCLPAHVFWNEMDLLRVGFDKVQSALKRKKHSLEFDFGMAISYSLGMSFYIPEMNEDLSIPSESVMVFEKGYYD